MPISWTSYNEDNIFWSEYVKIEESKIEDRSLKHLVKTFLDYFPGRENSRPEDRQFRFYFIYRTMPVSIFAVVFNLLELIAIYVRISRIVEGEVSVISRDSVPPWRAHFSVWVVLNLLCLFFYLLLFTMDKITWIGYNILDVLNMVGFAIAATRFYILLQTLLYVFTPLYPDDDGDGCMDVYILDPSDRSFRMVIVGIVLEALQVLFLSLMPLHRSHIIRLVIVECASQLIRYMTCYARLGLHEENSSLLGGYSFAIIAFYLSTILIPAFCFEMTFYSSYQHLLALQKTSQQKHELIHILCKDLKLPVQHGKQILEEARQVFLSMKLSEEESGTKAAVGEKREEEEDSRLPALSNLMEGKMNTITTIVDHLLFIMKMHEGRFQYHEEDVLHFSTMLDHVLMTLSHTLGGNNAFMSMSSAAGSGAGTNATTTGASSGSTRTPRATRRILNDFFDVAALPASGRIFGNQACLSIFFFYCLNAALIREIHYRSTKRKEEIDHKITLSLSLRRVKERLTLQGIVHPVLPPPAPSYTLDPVDEPVVSGRGAREGVGGGGSGRERRSFPARPSSSSSTLLREEEREYLEDRRRMDQHLRLLSHSDLLYHYQTSLMFCRMITRSCGGSFEHQEETGTMHFTFPCSVSDPSTNIGGDANRRDTTGSGGEAGGGVNGEEVGVGSERGAALHRTPSRDCLHPNVVDELCIYSRETVLSNLTSQHVLSMLSPLSDAMSSTSSSASSAVTSTMLPVPVFSQLNMADMQMHSIVMVTSISACVELRKKGYVGIIVLLSDRLAYLDDSDPLSIYDYVLSISSLSVTERSKLIQFLNAKVADSVATNARRTIFYSSRALEKMRQEESSSSSSGQYSNDKEDESGITYDSIGGVDRIGVKDSHQHLHGMVLIHSLWDKYQPRWAILPIIPSPSLLNYARWRYLNPSSSLLHHTSYIEAMVTVGFTTTLTLYFVYHTTRFAALFGSTPLWLLVLIRRLPMKEMTRWGRGFLVVIRVIAIYFVIAIWIQLLIFFAQRNPDGHGISIRHYHINQEDKQSFLDQNFIFTEGKQMLFAVAACITLSRYYADLVFWPYNVVVCVGQMLFVFTILQRILKQVFPRPIIRFISLCCLIGAAFVIGIAVYSERLRRKEFLELREYILSKDFLERAITIGWKDCLAPLTSLTAIQEALLSATTKETIESEKREGRRSWSYPYPHEKKVAAGQALVEKMEKFCFNITISKELLYAMQISLYLQSSASEGIRNNGSRSKGGGSRNGREQVGRDVWGGFGGSSRSISSGGSSAESGGGRGRREWRWSEKLQVHFMQPLLGHVAALFLEPSYSSASYPHHHSRTEPMIHFYLSIHPSLMIVKCDEALVEALLSNACRYAVNRIRSHPSSSTSATTAGSGRGLRRRKRFQRGGRGENGGAVGELGEVRYEVLISLTPLPSSMQPKNHPDRLELMLLSVYDTALQGIDFERNGSSVSLSSNASLTFMQALYEPFLSQEDLLGNSLTATTTSSSTTPFTHLMQGLDDEDGGSGGGSRYSGCQQILLPYQSCDMHENLLGEGRCLARQRIDLVDRPHAQYHRLYSSSWLYPPLLDPLDRFRLEPRWSRAARKMVILTLTGGGEENLSRGERRFQKRGKECFWDVRYHRLPPQGFPPSSIVTSADCILIGDDLFERYVFHGPRRFLEDLILSLRLQRFYNVLGLILPMDYDINHPATQGWLSPAPLPGHGDRWSVGYSLMQEEGEAGGGSIIMLNSVDIVYATSSSTSTSSSNVASLSISKVALVKLRETVDSRLISLALPSSSLSSSIM